MTYRLRLWVALLLTLVAAGGVAVSSYLSARSVDETTRQMLDERMVSLQLIANVEAAILQHDRCYYVYYATAFEPGARLACGDIQQALDRDLRALKRMLPNDQRIDAITMYFQQVIDYGTELENVLKGPDRDWDASRDLLGMVDALDMKEITPRLTSLAKDISRDAELTGSATRAQVQTTSNQVLGFAIAVVLVGALIGIYVERFTREAAERRRLAEFPERNPDAVITVNRFGELIYTNPAFIALQNALSESDLLPPGLINLINGAPGASEIEYSVEDRTLLASINPIDELNIAHLHIRDITERKRAEDKLLYAAEHDDLTGFRNRRRLRADFAQLKRNREGGVVGMLLFQPDRFQLITASSGPEIGDRLLVEISRRLRDVLLQQDSTIVPYRLDGAQIGLMGAFDDEQQLQLHVQSVLSALRAAFDLPVLADGADFYVAFSTGRAWTMIATAEAEYLLRNADAALRQASESAGGKDVLFADSMGRDISETVMLEAALRVAMNNNELYMVYQPQCRAADGHLTGFESLMRWRSPMIGDVSPARFIPVAEATGMIVRMGHWALQQSCLQAREWASAGRRDFQVGVNVSTRQLAEPDFVTQVAGVLADTGVDPALIKLEITESAIMQNVDEGIEILTQLRGLGLTLALDDFGTGHASLTYLQQLPVQRLKIDQSFVRPLPGSERDVSIVRTIIELGQRLGLRLIAEGVETDDQLALLNSLGCEEIQGYLFARPVAAEEAATYF